MHRDFSCILAQGSNEAEFHSHLPCSSYSQSAHPFVTFGSGCEKTLFRFTWKNCCHQTEKMFHSLLQAMKMKGDQKEQYSLARSSEDDLSKDSLLEKESNFYEQKRPPFWRRYRNMLLVQVVLLALYTLAMYFVAAKIRSQSLHEGPNLIHCTYACP